MTKTLSIEVSEELLSRLRHQAAHLGKTPELLAADYLSAMVLGPPGVGLRRWAGAFASRISDASLRHDKYLGQALYEELGENRGDRTVR